MQRSIAVCVSAVYLMLTACGTGFDAESSAVRDEPTADSTALVSADSRTEIVQPTEILQDSDCLIGVWAYADTDSYMVLSDTGYVYTFDCFNEDLAVSLDLTVHEGVLRFREGSVFANHPGILQEITQESDTGSFRVYKIVLDSSYLGVIVTPDDRLFAFPVLLDADNHKTAYTVADDVVSLIVCDADDTELERREMQCMVSEDGNTVYLNTDTEQTELLRVPELQGILGYLNYVVR